MQDLHLLHNSASTMIPHIAGLSRLSAFILNCMLTQQNACASTISLLQLRTWGCANLPRCSQCARTYWFQRKDSKLRPQGYEPRELPTAPPRDHTRCLSFAQNVVFQRRRNVEIKLRGQDLNLRPQGYEPRELPTAPPRDHTRYLTFAQNVAFNEIKTSNKSGWAGLEPAISRL